jgi:hypothetical protein
LRHHPLLRELGVLAFFVALSVALTWPLAMHLSTAVSDFGDPLLVTWILDWVDYALTHKPLELYDAPVFHPGILPLAYSENLIVPALLVLPFHLAGLAPVAVYNIAFLLGFALSGYGAYVAARMVSDSTPGAIVGGIFFAFCSFKFDHLPHLQIIFSAWVPLLLAALLAYCARPNWKRGALISLALIANGLTNVYYLMYAAVAVLFTVVALWILRRRGWKFYAGLAAAGIAAMVILYPFLKPYRTVSKHYRHSRNLEEVQAGSASWTNWAVPSRSSRVYGDIAAERLYAPERQLFPGLLILFLAATALVSRERFRAVSDRDAPETGDPPAATATRVRWAPGALIAICLALAWAAAVSDRVELKLFGARLLALDSSDIPMMAALLGVLILAAPRLRAAAGRSRFPDGAWIAAVWTLVGLIGSLGTNTFFYTFFYRRVEAFQSMRVPARFAVIVYAGLAVWGALNIAALLRKREGWKRTVIGTAIVALAIIEVAPSIRWEHVPRETAPVYAWLNRTRVGPVVEIPFSGDGVDYRYLLSSTAHRVKLVNGTSGFFPHEWWRLRHTDSRDDFDTMLTDMEQYGTRLVIVHGDFSVGDRHAKILAWLRRNLTSGRLAFLGRFDNEIAGDYVFAITRNLTDWRRHRLPEVPDGAGHLPQHNLARFLEGKPTHNDAIMIWMDEPAPYSVARGPLTVSGWTLSPHAIRRVTVFFQNDKLRFDAERFPRADVHAAYPWMRYLNGTPGFRLVIPKRPANIPLDTSLIVEVEDHAGRVRRGRHVSFRWEDAE